MTSGMGVAGQDMWIPPERAQSTETPPQKPEAPPQPQPEKLSAEQEAQYLAIEKDTGWGREDTTDYMNWLKKYNSSDTPANRKQFGGL